MTKATRIGRGYWPAIAALCCAWLLLGCGGDSGTSPGATGVRQPEGDVNAFWNQFDWSALTPAEQDLWRTLGWDEDSWQGDADPPPSEGADWSELSDSGREAATQLGYGEELWDTTVAEDDG